MKSLEGDLLSYLRQVGIIRLKKYPFCLTGFLRYQSYFQPEDWIASELAQAREFVARFSVQIFISNF